MTFAIEPGPLHLAIHDTYRRLTDRRIADALWSRRLDVWTSDPTVQDRIAARLGWLDAVDTMRPTVPRLQTFAQSIDRRSGVSRVVLLGMGGSSLAPEVLRAVYGVAPECPQFHVLDTVDPDTVRQAMAEAPTSVFIVASKSGTTIEVSCLTAEAERRLAAAGVADVGSHFVAITDDNTSLHRRAIERRFRDIFINPTDIGGRYSALSFFGLVPAALIGVDVSALIASAEIMAAACRFDDPGQNPGLALAAVMATAARAGRDKLLVVLPERLRRFGLWIEQLVAESIGKQGKGILPVLDPMLELLDADDSFVVATRLADEPTLPSHDWRAGPAVMLDVRGASALGGEFFRWEFATAVTGLLLEINPFDEPNVQEAKDATRAVLDIYGSQRRLPIDEGVTIDGARLQLTAAAKAVVGAGGVSTLLDERRPGDYFALLAYLPEDERFEPVLADLRRTISRRMFCPVTLGYGPRYLHSTGQLHKGGPNAGILTIVTAEPSDDFDVPGAPYSFGQLQLAQAIGDFQALDRNRRRAVHIHFRRRDPALIQAVIERILGLRATGSGLRVATGRGPDVKSPKPPEARSLKPEA